MKWVYLDNNATTRPAREVVQATHEMNTHLWANPSSIHRLGQTARHRVDLARASVARLINCRDRELVFTSGGTEACHLALRGVLDPSIPHTSRQDDLPSLKARLITTPIEHAAVREAAEWAAQLGVDVVFLPVQPGGWVDPEQLKQALDDPLDQAGLTLVSIQWVNNETGTIQPIDAIAQVIKSYRTAPEPQRRDAAASRILLHVDATQAVGKIPVDVQKTPVDLLTMSAHKFHGPKGIGALFLRHGVRLRVQQRGGPQEQQRRGGTENTTGIVGMGIAAELARDFVTDARQIDRLRVLRDRFESAVVNATPQAVVNATPQSCPETTMPDTACQYLDKRIWNTTNIGFPRMEAEAILLGLSERGVCASAGAACSSGSLEPSPVLLAMGIPEAVAHGSVRFSISRFTTDDEVDQAVELVTATVQHVARSLPDAIPS